MTENDDFLQVIESLFKSTHFIAEMYFVIPNADYHGLINVLTKHKDFFRDNVKWQIKHKDNGFELRVDRTNRCLEKKVI